MDRASDNYSPVFEYGYRNGMDVQSDLAYEARSTQEWIGQSDAIQDKRLYENAAVVAQERFRASEREYRQATDTGATSMAYRADDKGLFGTALRAAGGNRQQALATLGSWSEQGVYKLDRNNSPIMSNGQSLPWVNAGAMSADQLAFAAQRGASVLSANTNTMQANARTAQAALQPDTVVGDGITVGDLAVLNAAFDRRGNPIAEMRNFVGPLQQWPARNPEFIASTPYDWKRDSLIGKLTAGFGGDMWGATIGRLGRDDNLSVNPLTGGILSGRQEFDARFGLATLVVPGSRAMSGVRAAEIGINASRPGLGAIEAGYASLNSRQATLLEGLADVGSTLKVHRSEVSVRDIGALTASTGAEFGMFRRGSETLLVRGDNAGLQLSEGQLRALADKGYRLSAHSHPRINGAGDLISVGASGGDRAAIREIFNQQRSVIIDSGGNRNVLPVLRRMTV